MLANGIKNLKRLLQPASQKLTRTYSINVRNGAQELQVDELKPAVSNGFIGSCDFATLIFEFEAYPEPKILNPKELRSLIVKFGNSSKAADAIGACEAFVRQKAKVQ